MKSSKSKPNTSSSGFFGNLFAGKASNRMPNMYTTDKSGIKNQVYLPALIPAVLLVVYGLFVIWTASLSIKEASLTRQCFGVVVGSIAAFFVWRFDYRRLNGITIALLAFDVFLMIMPKIPGLGVEAKGIVGWVRIPFLGQFQPAEPAKLVTVFLMAGLASQYNGKIDRLEDYVKLCAVLLVPFFFILVQPDLGTGLVILFIGATIIIVAGAKPEWVWITIGLIVLGSAIIIGMSMTEGMPHPLKPYQLKRLLVFVDRSIDPTGDGFNLAQSEIAVGSGGIFGKGINNATQVGKGFLPEAHTDFIFALLSEEFGFIGSFLLLFLFGWLILGTISMAHKVESTFGKLVLVGVVAMWNFQVLENIGMCIGLMPITGIPLPFISYGSSSMVTQLMAVGLVQSVWKYRSKVS